jgi:amino acid transporter
MEWKEVFLGKPLKTEEEQEQQIGPAAGIPVLGLDALGSASYGPEAAMTVLLPFGLAATGYIAPITLCIIALLLAVYFSYMQTIPAYPNGGGSYTVAKENLGPFGGLLAAAALCLDYILNVAVAIAAGVGALVSAVPKLLPYTLLICLLALALLTIVNLRGIRATGILFMAPTYLFVATLFFTFAAGIFKGAPPHGFHGAGAGAAAHANAVVQVASSWALAHAFASGCAALTGIEAVSNAVPIFKKPTVKNARRTLTFLVFILIMLLSGVAFFSRKFGIVATPPGQEGYQSLLSQIVSAVMGRGGFYYTTMFSIIAVLCLSANTSFADFPRVCRALALDEYLPPEFAHRGSRLVYTSGILVLSALSGALLIGFRGVTDRLIPLFAVGAFGAFTISQLGMVMHWRRNKAGGNKGKLLLNCIGALATGVTLMITVAAKFKEGAWLIVITLPPVIILFLRIQKYQNAVDEEVQSDGPLDVENLGKPLIVVPLKRLDGVGRKALRLGLRMGAEVQAVQVHSEAMKSENLEEKWHQTVVKPAESAGLIPPKLVTIRSLFREFYGPFLDYLAKLAKEHPGRPIGVMVPELVEKKWYHFLFRHRATFLKGLILMKGGPQIFLINNPWYVEESAKLPEPEGEPMPTKVVT